VGVQLRALRTLGGALTTDIGSSVAAGRSRPARHIMTPSEVLLRKMP